MSNGSTPQKTKTIFEQEFEKLATLFRNKEIDKNTFKKETGLLLAKAFIDITGLKPLSESETRMAGYMGLNIMDAIKAAANNPDNKVMIILNQRTQEQEELKLSEQERKHILKVGRLKPARAFYELIKIYKARGEQSPYHSKGDSDIYTYKSGDMEKLLTRLEFAGYLDISPEAIEEKLFEGISNEGVDEIIDFEDIGVNINDYDKEQLSTSLSTMKSSIKEMRENFDKIIDLIDSDNKWKGDSWKSTCKTCSATLLVSLIGISGIIAGVALIYVEAASIPIGVAIAVGGVVLGYSMHDVLGAYGSTSHNMQQDIIKEVNAIEDKVKIVGDLINKDDLNTIDELIDLDSTYRDAVEKSEVGVSGKAK